MSDFLRRLGVQSSSDETVFVDDNVADARFQQLTKLREQDVPNRRRLIAKLDEFMSPGSTTKLGRATVTEVMGKAEYDLQLSSQRSVQGTRNKADYQWELTYYRKRMAVLPRLIYKEYTSEEQRHVQMVRRHLLAYIDMIMDSARDIEVAQNEPHPTRPDFIPCHETFFVPIHTVWCAHPEKLVEKQRALGTLSYARNTDDQETRTARGARSAKRARDDAEEVEPTDVPAWDDDGNTETTYSTPASKVTFARLPLDGLSVGPSKRRRTNTSTAAGGTVPYGTCENCKRTDTIVLNDREAEHVCSGCGFVQTERDINSTIGGLPFTESVQMTTKGSYKTTDNFMKHIRLMEGEDDGKIPKDCIDHCRRYAVNMTLNYENLRAILRRGWSKYYPYTVAILRILTDTQPLRLNDEIRRALRCMHILYWLGFLACPPEVRKGRKSSLTNNYLTYKFFQMLHLTAYLRGIRLLKDNAKIEQYDDTFAWIVDYVRRNYYNIPGVLDTWHMYRTPKRLDGE